SEVFAKRTVCFPMPMPKPNLEFCSRVGRRRAGGLLRVGVCSMLVVVGAAACAAAPTPPEAPNAQRAGAPAGRTEALPRLVVTPDSASSIPELYAQANAWLEQGEFARAARAFDRIVRLDPRGALAADAQFQAAIAHEEAGDLSAAVTRFEQLGRAYPEHALAREALVRSVRVFGHLEEWQRAERAADVLFARY